jgi:hypothetical protein
LREQLLALGAADPGEDAHLLAEGSREAPDGVDVAVARQHQPRALAHWLG